MEQISKHYTPGVCNINPTESVYRRKVSYVFFTALIVFVILSFVFSLHFTYAVITLPLLFIAVLNALQAKNNFCVMYAKAGKYNSSDDYAKTKSADDDNATKADTSKSRTMYLQTTVVSIIGTTLHASLLAAL